MHISKRWYSPNRYKHEMVEATWFSSCSYLPVQDEPIHLHINQDVYKTSTGEMKITLSKVAAKMLAESLLRYVKGLEEKGQ
jgi:hypothetical protein